MKISIKQFFLFTFILLECISAWAFATPVLPNPVDPGNTSVSRITISISITIARRRDCEGFGICDWSVGIDRTKPNSCSGKMYLDDYNRNIVVLEVERKNGLSLETYSRYFSTGTFLMEDDSPIPDNIARDLGLPGSKTLIAGKHKVTEKNGVLVISIPIK